MHLTQFETLPQRWVIFDTETTGLLPSQDRMVSIGALSIQGMEIRPEDSFECVIRIRYNSSAVVIHGITREQAEREGIEEKDAVEQFREYLGDSVLVGHHVAFDAIILNHALRRHGHPMLENPMLDLMRLVLAMEAAQLINKRPDPSDFGLDMLLDHYQIGKKGRHTAMGDSFLTALIFLQLLGNCRHHPDLLRTVVEPNAGLGTDHKNHP